MNYTTIVTLPRTTYATPPLANDGLGWFTAAMITGWLRALERRQTPNGMVSVKWVGRTSRDERFRVTLENVSAIGPAEAALTIVQLQSDLAAVLANPNALDASYKLTEPEPEPEPEDVGLDEDGKQFRAVITDGPAVCPDCGLSLYSCQCPTSN